MFAVIACAVAIPAAVPQPETPIGARAAVGVEQRVPLEKRQIEAAAGPEGAEDLKGSSSFGYGYDEFTPIWKDTSQSLHFLRFAVTTAVIPAMAMEVMGDHGDGAVTHTMDTVRKPFLSTSQTK